LGRSKEKMTQKHKNKKTHECDTSPLVEYEAHPRTTDYKINKNKKGDSD